MRADALRGDARVRARTRSALIEADDPIAVSAALRELARYGVRAPEGLLDRARTLDVDLPLDVWVAAPDGPECIGATPDPCGVAIPADTAWWVAPSGPVEPDALARVVLDAGIDGVLAAGADAAAQLRALVARSPLTLRRVTITAEVGPQLLAEVAALPALAALHVQDRSLHDPSLRALRHGLGLRELSVHNPIIDDDGLHELAGLRLLRRLNLVDAAFRGGAALAALGTLPGLERLSLRGARGLRPGVIAELAIWPALRELDLSECVGVDRPTLRALTRGPVRDTLSALALTSCVGEDALDALALLPALESVQLGGAELGDRAVQALAHAPPLSRLDLTAGNASGAGLAGLGGPRLTSLTLEAPRVDPHAVAELIARSTQLTALALVATPADDPILRAIGACARLETLDLALPPVAGPRLRFLAGVPRLRRLRVKGALDARDLRDLSTGFPALRELDIDTHLVSGEALTRLEALRGLRVLRLREARWDYDGCPCCEDPAVVREPVLAHLLHALPGCRLEILGHHSARSGARFS